MEAAVIAVLADRWKGDVPQPPTGLPGRDSDVGMWMVPAQDAQLFSTLTLQPPFMFKITSCTMHMQI